MMRQHDYSTSKKRQRRKIDRPLLLRCCCRHRRHRGVAGRREEGSCPGISHAWWFCVGVGGARWVVRTRGRGAAARTCARRGRHLQTSELQTVDLFCDVINCCSGPLDENRIDIEKKGSLPRLPISVLYCIYYFLFFCLAAGITVKTYIRINLFSSTVYSFQDWKVLGDHYP
jgi:hypothetical protein